MSIIPGATKSTYTERAAFGKTVAASRRSATIHEDTEDAGNSPVTQLRRGLIVGKDANGKFIHAESGSVEAHTKSHVTSLEAPDGDWAGETVKVTVEGLGSVEYTVDAGVTNLASFISDFNASPASAFATASTDTTKVRITANKPGVAIGVQSSLAGAFNLVADTDTEDSSGELTPYGCLQDGIPSMLDNGVAVDRQATLLTRNFELLSADIEADNLTMEAREYFARNGVSIVEG